MRYLAIVVSEGDFQGFKDQEMGRFAVGPLSEEFHDHPERVNGFRSFLLSIDGLNMKLGLAFKPEEDRIQVVFSEIEGSLPEAIPIEGMPLVAKEILPILEYSYLHKHAIDC